MKDVRTWIEIDKKALEHNLREFLNLIPEKTRFMAVIKSNAYGHGLVLTARVLAGFRLSAFDFQRRLWFGVDSIVEGLRLRRENIKNPILVLGSTLPSRIKEARDENIILTVSSSESLNAVAKFGGGPAIHLKIDTGMHRQGFLPEDIPLLIKKLKSRNITPDGVYTHFASAKDAAYPTYTLNQLSEFNKIISMFQKSGFKGFLKHTASSGGAILFPKSHLDMVRIGMGIYGYWPSQEARISLPAKSKVKSQKSKVILKPVLTWKTIVSEVKEVPKESFIGYDLTERVSRKTKIAVLPIGYWHGYDRGLSSIGEVLIRGRRARVLGRVSMDMIVVDVTDIDNKLKAQSSKLKVGDEAVLIGRQGRDAIWADELALKIGTSQYEVLTRINPLIRRIFK